MYRLSTGLFCSTAGSANLISHLIRPRPTIHITIRIARRQRSFSGAMT